MHLFSPGLSEQFAKLYHGVALQPLYCFAPEYLLTRFAWTVFAYSAQFLQRGIKGALYIIHDGETFKQEVNGDQCMQLYLSRRSRSLSPSKRKRDDARHLISTSIQPRRRFSTTVYHETSESHQTLNMSETGRSRIKNSKHISSSIYKMRQPMALSWFEI